MTATPPTPRDRVSHLHTAEDIANARAALMEAKEHFERVDGGRGFRQHRVTAGIIAAAITFRAIELGLETHE